MKRRILLGSSIFAGTVLVLLGALVAIGHFYEDEVKAELLAAVNENLNGPVEVRSIEFTLLDRFPLASLHLRGVLAREALPEKTLPDTLLYAEDLYLEFSMWSLITGDYGVDRIHGEHVRLYPGREADGRDNWFLWKSDSTAGEDLDLSRVSMEDLTLRYHDHGNKLLLEGHCDQLSMKGRFGEQGSRMDLQGDLHLIQWRADSTVLLSDRVADVQLAMSFGASDGVFRITEGRLLAGKVPLEIDLSMTPDGEDTRLDLRANGLGLDLERVIALLPNSLQRQLRRYGSSGEVDIALHYAGPMDDPGPSLSVGMKVHKGRMKELTTGTTFKDINGEVAFDLAPDGTPSRILVKGLSARSGGGTLRADMLLKGLRDAPLTLDLKSDIPLTDLLRFARIDTLEQVSGRMRSDIHVKGKVRDVADLRAKDLARLAIGGTLQLDDATLKMKGVRHRIGALHADLELRGNDALVKDLRAEVQGSTVQLEGELRNLVPYLLFSGEVLAIQARGNAPFVDLAAWISSEGEAASSKDYALQLPAQIQLDLKVNIGKLVFEQFVATDLSGTVLLRDRKLIASPVTFNTAGGAVLGSLELDGRNPASYPLAINATVRGIAIDQLFAEFQDFGQDFITSRHLKGRANAQITFTTPLSPAMVPDLDRLHCVADLDIKDGELIGHKPMIDVATHLRKNKLVAPFVDTEELERQLRHVHFSELHEQVEIKHRTVYIPEMVVRTSVMDITMSGEHGFDDHIDHHINFRLADLFRKGRVKDEFGPVVDDGTGSRIFLHMYGTASDPQFANDGAMAAAKRKQQFEQEKAELRSILKNELNIFGKKEQRTGKDTEAAPGTIIRVDLGDPDSTATPSPKKKKKGLFRGLGEGDSADGGREVITVE